MIPTINLGCLENWGLGKGMGAPAIPHKGYKQLTSLLDHVPMNVLERVVSSTRA